MMTFYHVRWCPECNVVRERLEALNVPYEDILVPDARAHRKQVFDVSGQYYVPVLKDGDLVLTETWDIIEHLETRYGEGAAGADAPRDPSRSKTTSRTSAELGEDDQYPSCQR